MEIWLKINNISNYEIASLMIILIDIRLISQSKIEKI